MKTKRHRCHNEKQRILPTSTLITKQPAVSAVYQYNRTDQFGYKSQCHPTRPNPQYQQSATDQFNQADEVSKEAGEPNLMWKAMKVMP